MINDEKIKRFINYNYVCFSKKQCIKRLVFIWLLSIGVCMIGRNNTKYLFCFIFLNLVVTAFFCYLIFKLSNKKISRFLCDGVYYLDVSLILNVASYRILALKTGDNLILLLIFIILLLVFELFLMLIVFISIKNDRYNKESKSNKKILPFVCALIALTFSKFFLSGFDEQIALDIVSWSFLIVSFFVGVGSLNLLKAILNQQINNFKD